jgi:ankyrin repeat protein
MINRFITALLPLLLLNGCGGGSSDQSKPTGNQSDTVDNSAELSLIEAAEAGELEVVEKLLGSGVDVNEQSDDQSTALHLAAQEGHVEVARRLIEAGADINAKDDIDQTPGDRARFWKQDKVLELLDSNSILEAAREGDLQTVLAQLESGVDVNHANASGDTALTYAAFMGHAEVVALLIEKEVNVNASGLAGWTALHLAAQRGHEKIVEQLIAKGAEINALTEEGFGGTPLDVADANLAELLRKHGGKTADALK